LIAGGFQFGQELDPRRKKLRSSADHFGTRWAVSMPNVFPLFSEAMVGCSDYASDSEQQGDTLSTVTRFHAG
jgi:hypothetical protein